MRSRPLPSFVHTPGLFKATGQWAFARGVFKPEVFIDPLAEVQLGGNALILHEATHCYMRDALRGILLLCLFPPLYIVHRRMAEVRADREAYRCSGRHEFRSFVYMSGHPTSLWGRFLYGKSAESRIERASGGQV